jgi:tRNA nucleotidyltransferase (CCA-adding enzyme)
MKLAQDMTRTGMLNHLTAERIWKEIETALNTEHFDKFIRTMRECGALKVVFPEVNKLWNMPERTDYHPEGNSGEHTMLHPNIDILAIQQDMADV